jgi:hypothetical protein
MDKKSSKPKPKESKPKESKPKPKPKPKPKAKPKPKPKLKQSKEPKVKHKNKGNGITIIQEKDNLGIDQYYEKKVNGIINKIKQQNQMIDDKIRFGWNSGD